MPQDGHTYNSTPKKLPSPLRTAEFPAGLISDYIKLVDQLTLKTRKA
jgi:hypothetical protein